MSFWNSGIIKKLESGDLPEVKTNSTITIDSDSLVKLGAVMLAVSVVTIIMLWLTKGQSAK